MSLQYIKAFDFHGLPYQTFKCYSCLRTCLLVHRKLFLEVNETCFFSNLIKLNVRNMIIVCMHSVGLYKVHIWRMPE